MLTNRCTRTKIRDGIFFSGGWGPLWYQRGAERIHIFLYIRSNSKKLIGMRMINDPLDDGLTQPLNNKLAQCKRSAPFFVGAIVTF